MCVGQPEVMALLGTLVRQLMGTTGPPVVMIISPQEMGVEVSTVGAELRAGEGLPEGAGAMLAQP